MVKTIHSHHPLGSDFHSDDKANVVPFPDDHAILRHGVSVSGDPASPDAGQHWREQNRPMTICSVPSKTRAIGVQTTYLNITHRAFSACPRVANAGPTTQTFFRHTPKTREMSFRKTPLRHIRNYPKNTQNDPKHVNLRKYLGENPKHPKKPPEPPQKCEKTTHKSPIIANNNQKPWRFRNSVHTRRPFVRPVESRLTMCLYKAFVA